MKGETSSGGGGLRKFINKMDGPKYRLSPAPGANHRTDTIFPREDFISHLHGFFPPGLGHFFEDGDVSLLPAGHFVAMRERSDRVLVDPGVERLRTEELHVILLDGARARVDVAIVSVRIEFVGDQAGPPRVPALQTPDHIADHVERLGGNAADGGGRIGVVEDDVDVDGGGGKFVVSIFIIDFRFILLKHLDDQRGDVIRRRRRRRNGSRNVILVSFGFVLDFDILDAAGGRTDDLRRENDIPTFRFSPFDA